MPPPHSPRTRKQPRIRENEGHDLRWLRPPAARHRSGRDQRVARELGIRRRDRRQDPRPLPDLEVARALPRTAGRLARHGVDAVREHHPERAGALVPRRRIHRAPHPGLHQVERRGHGDQGQQARRRHRRPPVDVRVVGLALRSRLQPFLPRQGRRAGRRPHLLPGARGARCVRPRVPRRPPHRRRSRPLPPRDRAGWAIELSAPAAHARLLGVPDGVDGPRPHHRDLSRSLQPLPPQPATRRHRGQQGVGVRRRRRVRRARDARRALAGGAREARQPDLRRELQPAAARRSGARQRQDHPGARGRLPRRGLERDQGHLGFEVGRAAGARRRRRAAQQDEHHRRRRVPALHDRVGRLHP